MGLVVDRGVEPEVVDQPRALLVGARNSDDATAKDLRDLSRDAADTARRAGHDEHVAGLHLPDVEDADERGDTGDAEHADRVQQFDVVGERHHERTGTAADAQVLLPPAEAGHLHPDREHVGLRRDDGADDPAAHHLAELDRREVALFVVEPAADRRIDREVRDLDDRFAVLRVGHGVFDELEAVLRRHTDGPLRQQHLSIGRHGRSVGSTAGR